MSICVNLRPLKASILKHVEEWISTLGIQLKHSAQVSVKSFTDNNIAIKRRIYVFRSV